MNFWKKKCFALLLQVNFPANNLNFHWRWRWWNWIQAIFLNLFYFTCTPRFSDLPLDLIVKARSPNELRVLLHCLFDGCTKCRAKVSNILAAASIYHYGWNYLILSKYNFILSSTQYANKSLFDSLLAEAVYNLFFSLWSLCCTDTSGLVWTSLDKSEHICRMVPNPIIEFGVIQSSMLLNQIFADLEGKNIKLVFKEL